MAMGPILGPGRRGRRSPMSEINVTPMVDVMLVLLIIFMVTAPLLTAGVQVDLPESKAAALEQDQEPVSISIDPSGAVFVDDAPVADGERQQPEQGGLADDRDADRAGFGAVHQRGSVAVLTKATRRRPARSISPITCITRP